MVCSAYLTSPQVAFPRKLLGFQINSADSFIESVKEYQPSVGRDRSAHVIGYLSIPEAGFR